MIDRDEIPFVFYVVYWSFIAAVLQVAFLLIGALISYLTADLQSYWLVAVCIYLYAVSVPLLVFYILVFSVSPAERATAVALIFCLVVLVPMVYAVFYFLLGCLDFENKLLADNLYFSFLTFSTLGYGDYGLKAQCKPFAVGQSVYGLLVVAGLVSLVAKQSN